MQKIINTSLMLVLLGLVILWAGCAPTTEVISTQAQPTAEAAAPAGERVIGQVTNIAVPDWFVDIPQDPNYMYAVGSSDSKALDMGLDEAKNGARVDIANQVQVKVSGLFKRFREEVGVGEDAEMMAMTTAVSKEVISETLSGARVAQQEITKEGNVYYTYVLMEVSMGEMNTAALDKVKANKDLYTRFRASQGFKELEAEVEKYEQWKKEQ